MHFHLMTLEVETDSDSICAVWVRGAARVRESVLSGLVIEFGCVEVFEYVVWWVWLRGGV